MVIFIIVLLKVDIFIGKMLFKSIFVCVILWGFFIIFVGKLNWNYVITSLFIVDNVEYYLIFGVICAWND